MNSPEQDGIDAEYVLQEFRRYIRTKHTSLAVVTEGDSHFVTCNDCGELWVVVQNAIEPDAVAFEPIDTGDESCLLDAVQARRQTSPGQRPPHNTHIDEAKCVNAHLADRLRQLADVLEHEEVPDLQGYAALFSDGHILIKESAFLKLFAGQSVSGRKDGGIIYASAKAYGITFDALLYDSDDSRVSGVTIQL